MNNRFVMLRNALLMGVSFGLAACGGGAGGSAIVTTPPPVVAPAPTATPPVATNETKTFKEGLTARINGYDYYQKGEYIVYPNSWGAEGKNIPKTEYSQTVKVETASFPNKTLITWKYPDTVIGDGSQVYGFPGIAWGNTTLALSGYSTTGSIAQVQNISEFATKFDVTLTGDMKYMNLAHDLFMYNSTGQIGAEILYSVKPSDHYLYWANPNNYFGQQPGAQSFQFNMNGASYNMLVSSFSTGGLTMNTDPNGKMILIIPTDGSELTSGTIDWMPIFKILLDNKKIDPTWTIKGVEMGVEVQAGKGSMLINNYAVTLKQNNQKVQAMVITAVNTTTAATQLNAATVQQAVQAALANPQSTTYGFSQGNAGIGTNLAISDKLSLGTSTVFAQNGYTLASSLAWRNKNTHALLMTGTGNQRIQNTNTQSTFALLEAGTRIPTRLAAFQPYARMGYTRYYNTAATMNSMRLAGGMNAYVPISRSLLLRMSGELSNEFAGKGTARASMNGITGSAPINVSGVEYTGSVNLSNGIGMIEAGTRKNRMGTNNYVSAGMRVPF